MRRTEHLSLVHVDPLHNKWRVYLLQVHLPDSPTNTDQSFGISCSWGRLHQSRRTLNLVFGDREDMMSYLESILKRRKRNGYQIIDQSHNFPHSPTLADFPHTNNIGGQLTLFGSHVHTPTSVPKT